jgi:hypothetical protein
MKLPALKRGLIHVAQFVQGKHILTEAQGRLSSLWVAAGAKKGELSNGSYYEPVGVLGKLDAIAQDEKFGKELWDYTQEVLEQAE